MAAQPPHVYAMITHATTQPNAQQHCQQVIANPPRHSRADTGNPRHAQGSLTRIGAAPTRIVLVGLRVLERRTAALGVRTAVAACGDVIGSAQR